MKKVMIILGVLLLVGMQGCGGKGRKYIGRYISKDTGYVLEIKKDGTWEKEFKQFDHIAKMTGEWEVKGDRIILYDDSIGSTTYIEGELEDNTLIDRCFGRGSFVKQD